MYKIAIVEDEWESADNLVKCFDQYARECKVVFNLVRFKTGVDFVEEFTPDFDIVFMDVDMPKINGFDTAKELREQDPDVPLVFVTFLAKYALRGYEVDATGYMVKPVSYPSFRITLERAIKKCNRRKKTEVTLPSAEGELRIELPCLHYVEIADHDITYHTSQGNYKAYGTLRAIEDILPASGFSKCNRSCLVNLRNVTRIQGSSVFIGKEELEISRTRKKEFMDALHAYHMSKTEE